MNIQWRTNNAYDSVLIVTDDGYIRTGFSPANRGEIAALLTNLGDLSNWHGTEYPDDEVTPETYGEMVMERADDGAVLDINIILFRERLAFWFRGS